MGRVTPGVLRRPVSTAVATLAVGALVGMAIALAGSNAVAIAFGALAAVLFLVIIGKRVVALPGYLGIEVPALLVLFSTIVWRLRDTTSLASTPLDAAGLLRLAALGIGGLLGIIAILRGDVRGLFGRLRGALPLWLYVLYIGVVTLGVSASSFPSLTAFRAANLLALLAVIVGAYQTAGAEAVRRLEKVVLWFMVSHLSTVWFWVVVSPHQALRHTTSPFPYRIEGIFPSMSTDRIGEYGVVLFFWGLASWIGIGQDRIIRSRRASLALSGFGAVSLLFAQYRTGYVAMAIGIVLLLAVRRKWLWLGALAVGAAASVAIPGVLSFLLRGQSAGVASHLSGRNVLWSAAIPVWKHSPIIGNGLETASRFDVLQGLGRGFTSTLHSTWVEALVGTGVAGTTLLVSAVVLLGWRTFMTAVRKGRLVPFLLISILVIRSATGTSFEALSVESMLFLILTLGARKRRPDEPTDQDLRVVNTGGRVGLDWTHPDLVPVGASSGSAGG